MSGDPARCLSFLPLVRVAPFVRETTANGRRSGVAERGNRRAWGVAPSCFCSSGMAYTSPSTRNTGSGVTGRTAGLALSSWSRLAALRYPELTGV
jgi:hypothetical protein